jgi:hypothetical protein
MLAQGKLVWSAETLTQCMRTAVELDRRGIVVTDEDVREALTASTGFALPSPERDMWAALVCFAKRLRGEA